MSAAGLHLKAPPEVADYLRNGKLRRALAGLAQLAGTELTISPDQQAASSAEPTAASPEIPIVYRGRAHGSIGYSEDGTSAGAQQTAHALAQLLEHLLEREKAVSDLADAMFTCYDELTMLYTLLPKLAAKAYPREIAEVLVDETARTLNCRRVTLMMLDENAEALRLLASRGLPPEARNVSIRVRRSSGGQLFADEEFLLTDHYSRIPKAAILSGAPLENPALAIIHAPLRARGEALGVLTATDRTPSAEFTARDRKLMEGLSAMAASALMNCRLHAAVSNQMLSTIQALATAVDAKDQYTHDHSGRVAQLCVATAREMGVTSPDSLREMELAGLLHDIGKIGIPDSILSKTQPLTPDEFAMAKTHVFIGASIVEQVRGLERVAEAILHHHERYDGMGYPSGLIADAIPFASRLIAVADVFDTLTSNRPYRKASDADRALGELARSRETHLDPSIVDAFTSVVRRDIGRRHRMTRVAS